MTLQQIARIMGGVVSAGGVNCPGPGHKPCDRSLRIFLDAQNPDVIRTHSFAGDDPTSCLDYALSKLGLPQREPSRTRDNGRAYTNGHAKPKGNSAAFHQLPAADPVVIKARARVQDDTTCALLPSRTCPDADGKPQFYQWGDDGPPPRNELRRHIYRRDGVPVRIKVKNANGGYVQWFRVRDGNASGWQAKRPGGYVSVPYVGAINPFDSELAGDPIVWPEGEKDCDTLANVNLPAFTFGGCGDGVPDDAAVYLTGRHIVVFADNDNPGRDHAQKKAAFARAAGAASVRIVQFPDLSTHGDVSDFIRAGGTAGELMQRANAAPLWQPPPLAAPHDQTTQVSTGESRLIVRRASEIEPKSIEWLWPLRLAIGKQTLIAGEPGLGKSQLTIALAAAVTTSGHWPCGEGRASLGSVIILSAEDDAADTIVPRLSAAGADLDRVLIVSSVQQRDGQGRRVFNLQADLELLERKINAVGDVRLVIIDPISSYLGKTDSHNNSDVRGTLEPLGEMAARLRVAVVSVTHLSKSGGTSAINRFIGSIGFVASARAAFIVTRDPDDNDRRFFITAKNNLAKDGSGLAFRIEQRLIPLKDGSETIASAIAWEGDRIDRTADEVMATNENGGSERSGKNEAVEFLKDILAQGPVDVLEMEKQARAAGLLGDTQRLRQSKPFRTARKEMGILSERDGFGIGARYLLRLPDAPCAPHNPMCALTPDRAHMDRGGAHEDEVDGRNSDAPQNVTTEEHTTRSETSQPNKYEHSDAVTLSDEEGEWTV